MLATVPKHSSAGWLKSGKIGRGMNELSHRKATKMNPPTDNPALRSQQFATQLGVLAAHNPVRQADALISPLGEAAGNDPPTRLQAILGHLREKHRTRKDMYKKLRTKELMAP
jgi:hypothetical protein